MKFTIEQRVENFKKYYVRENERPLFGFYIRSEYPLQRYGAAKEIPERNELTPEDFPVEGYVKDSKDLFEEHEACGGDFIWSASAFWGIPWVEAALGCPIIADHSTGSIHTEKPENISLPEDIPEFDENSPWLVKMDEFLKALAEGSNGKWPLATTRMRGIADLLSTFYGGDSFVFKMMEAADEVHEVCEKFTDFWLKMAKFQLERIPDFHGGVGSFYYNMWAPAGTVWHQEDASALLSPGLYDQFIKPYDEKIAKELDNCIMHLHPSGFMPIEQLVEMEMTAIELHVDEGGKPARELNEHHKKIMAKKPLLIWGHLSEDDMDYIFSELPAEGLAVMTTVENPVDAVKYWEKYMSKYGV